MTIGLDGATATAPILPLELGSVPSEMFTQLTPKFVLLQTPPPTAPM
jgi:hypothetical protein